MNLHNTASAPKAGKRLASLILVTALLLGNVTEALAATFVIGDRVQVTSGPLNVRSKPSPNSTILGTQPTGALGAITSGPKASGGYTWWKVNYDTGVDGWSVENYLTKAPVVISGTLTTLTKGVSLAIAGVLGSQTMYQLTVPSGATNLSFTTSGGTGDADLYMKFGSQPTLTSYTLKSALPASAETISVAAPSAGTYYLLVNGYTAYSGVTLIANYTVTVADTQAPSVPTGLIATAISSSQINLSWSASTDNVGVAGYKIYRGGTLLASVSGTTYSNTGLTASTAYTYTVAAYDAAGNNSAQSTGASATTLAMTPPSISSFTATPASITAGQSTTLTWTQTGATTLTLTPGSVNVTGQTSLVVTPSTSTTYTLTATNGGGSVTKSVVVTVTPAPAINLLGTGVTSAYYPGCTPSTVVDFTDPVPSFNAAS